MVGSPALRWADTFDRDSRIIASELLPLGYCTTYNTTVVISKAQRRNRRGGIAPPTYGLIIRKWQAKGGVGSDVFFSWIHTKTYNEYAFHDNGFQSSIESRPESNGKEPQVELTVACTKYPFERILIVESTEDAIARGLFLASADFSRSGHLGSWYLSGKWKICNKYALSDPFLLMHHLTRGMNKSSRWLRMHRTTTTILWHYIHLCPVRIFKINAYEEIFTNCGIFCQITGTRRRPLPSYTLIGIQLLLALGVLRFKERHLRIYPLFHFPRVPPAPKRPHARGKNVLHWPRWGRIRERNERPRSAKATKWSKRKSRSPKKIMPSRARLGRFLRRRKEKLWPVNQHCTHLLRCPVHFRMESNSLRSRRQC